MFSRKVDNRMTFDDLLSRYEVPLPVAMAIDAAVRDGATISGAIEFPCSAHLSSCSCQRVFMIPITKLPSRHYGVLAGMGITPSQQTPINNDGSVWIAFYPRAVESSHARQVPK